MITKSLIDYLDDDNVRIENKRLLVKKLDLPYSDIFKLLDIYDGKNFSVYSMLHSFIIYKDSRFEERIKKQNRKNIVAKKTKKTKFMRSVNSYD